ncbi:MAG: HEPN domain-containing protein [Anaerolineae bacterium]
MKPEVQALLQKAHASRKAAGLLAEQDYLDFAASRAYYAQFYTAEALLLSQGLAFSSHAAVIAAFGREFARRIAWICAFTAISLMLKMSATSATTESARV